jgi:hypothetical protein
VRKEISSASVPYSAGKIIAMLWVASEKQRFPCLWRVLDPEPSQDGFDQLFAPWRCGNRGRTVDWAAGQARRGAKEKLKQSLILRKRGVWFAWSKATRGMVTMGKHNESKHVLEIADLYRLNRKAAIVWLGIMDLAREAGALCFHTNRILISQKCGLAQVDSITSILRALQGAGYLTFKRQFVNSKIHLTIQILHPDFEIRKEAGSGNGNEEKI